MALQRYLRRFSVGQRVAAIIVLLLLPMATLSVVSVAVLNHQEMAFRESVEESVHTLLPLTTLEQYLDRALVDELEAQSDESVPDFAALTQNIDHSFSRIETSDRDPDLLRKMVVDAQRDWRLARPSVTQLVEHVRQLHATAQKVSDAQAQGDLQKAIGDIHRARAHLAAAVKARYQQAAATRHSQLLWLVWSWVITLSIAALLIAAFLHSLLRPVRELAQAAHRLGAGETGVRVPMIGRDELTALAERFNDMAGYWETTRASLATEASEDALTGLLNRRGILALLGTELAAHQRDKRPISVFMIDLNRFKEINDRYGHSAGDRALTWASVAMREALRDSDFLGRYGGDEFLAILPDTTQAQAQDIARRMSHTIAETARDEHTRPTISLGIASAPEDGWHATELIDMADAALYKAKQRRQSRSPVTRIGRR